MATRVPSPDAIRLSGSLSVVRPAAAQTAGGFETFIRIAADGTVTAFNGHVDLGTGIDPGAPNRRVVRINGAPAAANALADWLTVLWLTPAMDRLFVEPAS